MRQTNQLTFKTLRSASIQDQEAEFLCQEVLGNFLTKTDEKYIRVAGFLDGKICATAMLIRRENLFQITNLVVTPDLQNKGIGSEILKFCEELVLEKGVVAIYCLAQDYQGKSAVNFFLKNQYFCRENDSEKQVMLKFLGE